MKIAYFSCQMPYPATHGGLVDDWARLNAFKAAGADLALVTWYADREAPLEKDRIEALAGIASVAHALPVRSGWKDRVKRLVRLVRWPSHVSSRIPLAGELSSIWRSLDAFRPEAVWLDALYPIWLARATASRYGVPMFYRSHNVEHRYMQGQVARATSVRDWLAWSLNLPHLRRVEFDIWRRARAVFDISMDDLAWWHSQGFTQGVWLPPLVQPEKANALSAAWSSEPQFEVAYLGNLRTPNNVEGVLWFLKEVWPRLHQAHPAWRLQVAGSSPAASIIAAMNGSPNAVLLENPPEAAPVLRDARVLVNPIFAGSGVNVKSVEMLYTPARLVSAPQGVAGLPADVAQCFAVASRPGDFANAIAEAVVRGPLSEAESAQRERARAEFSYQRANDVLRLMRAHTRNAGSEQ